MKKRFKVGDTVYYVCILREQHLSALSRIPIIGHGTVKEYGLNGYVLDGKTMLVYEPFVYAERKQAVHEYITALLRYLRDVSNAREAAIEKLSEYGIGGFADQEEATGYYEENKYAKKQVEYIRSIPESNWTPVMRAVIESWEGDNKE